MLDRDETVMAVKERMHTLSPSDICALFLVSADKKKQENEAAGPDWDEAAKRIQSLLGRFFRQTDIVGRIGENRYAAFLAGTLTERAVWEKASTLSEAFWFASEEIPDGYLSCYVGVYLFYGNDTAPESAYRAAAYALEMAKKEERRNFYICTSRGTGALKKMPDSPDSTFHLEALQELKFQYSEKKEWLYFLARETGCQLWEVDLKTKVFRFFYFDQPSDGRKTVYENFPDSLIETGRIHKDSASRFRSFAKEMLEGKAADSANFMIQYRKTSCYGWAALSYHMLHDEEGHPVKAIGVKEDFSYSMAGAEGLVQRRAMPSSLYPHLYCYLQANLSRDKVEKLQIEGRSQVRLSHYQTFTEVTEKGFLRLFSVESGNRLRNTFGREKLLEDYKKGKRWLFDRCQVVDSEGMIQWISFGVNLSRDAETGEICLFAYLSNRNQKLKWEGEIRTAVSIDPASGVYSLSTAERIIRHLLDTGGQTMCALAKIRIGGLEEVFGGDENRRQEVMTALNTFLDTDCLIGQESKNSLLVFFPQPVSKSRLKRRIEEAFSFTRLSFDEISEMKYLRFVAGMDCQTMEDASYESMKQTASRLCALHEAEAEDTVVFSESGDKYRWSSVELENQAAEQLDSQPLEHSALMTEEDKDMVIDCMGLMLKSGSTDTSVDGVLMKLGQYYQADRVYILTLTEHGRIITMINEWDGKGKYSIQQSISGKRTEQFPVIARYAKKPQPVFLSMKEPLPDDGGDKISWQYVIFPMDKFQDSEQLLCIENPRKEILRTALLDTILPYLGKERKRFTGKWDSAAPLDLLYSLPDLKACMNMAYSLDSDVYGSLGVLAADIPDLAGLKEQRGFEYGSRLLLRMSEVLRDVFGSSFLFHTKEAEFIVFCVNVTYESFLNQCARVRHLMGRQYSGQFRVGCTWSDGIFKAPDLMSKAQSIMKCAGHAEITAEEFAAGSAAEKSKSKKGASEEASREISGEKQLTIYLQPKVDIRTGQLVGAEALARVINEKGELQPHGQVIEAMEQNGTIQELDYYVFGKVLDMLSQWKQKGYPLRPVSSNFSRNTLLNPTSLASVLAILSRYPEIPQELVELEITETAGDFENHTFSEMIRRFGEYGLRFSLDDFGSSYSNMSMLADLHFSSVKIDRSMIRNIAVNKVARTMVRDVIRICRDYGMVCVAEGVETGAQANTLLEDGGRYAQGYFYGKPMPVEEFEKRYFQAKK